MTTSAPSTGLVPVAPAFTTAERLALAGFLAGYTGLTRQAYELDLRVNKIYLDDVRQPPHAGVTMSARAARPGSG
jgi:hypothetical protein